MNTYFYRAIVIDGYDHNIESGTITTSNKGREAYLDLIKLLEEKKFRDYPISSVDVTAFNLI